jgi:hypothetical protein
VLGVFLGIVMISLLSMPQKGEHIYDLIDCGEALAAPADTYSLPASEILSTTSSGEARPQRDLRVSVAAP